MDWIKESSDLSPAAGNPVAGLFPVENIDIKL